MTSTLLRVLPKHIQQHLHLQMTSTSDYASSARQMVLSYEVASSTYSTGRIHAELGVVTSYAAPTGSDPQPLEIHQIAQARMQASMAKAKAKGSLQKASINMMANQEKAKEMIWVPMMVKERRLIAINVLIA